MSTTLPVYVSRCALSAKPLARSAIARARREDRQRSRALLALFRCPRASNPRASCSHPRAGSGTAPGPWLGPSWRPWLGPSLEGAVAACPRASARQHRPPLHVVTRHSSYSHVATHLACLPSDRGWHVCFLCCGPLKLATLDGW